MIVKDLKINISPNKANTPDVNRLRQYLSVKKVSSLVIKLKILIPIGLNKVKPTVKLAFAENLDRLSPMYKILKPL